VRDDSFVDWSPRIDVEIACWAIEAGGGACEDFVQVFVHACTAGEIVGSASIKKHLQEPGGVFHFF